ncbi:unnamed protein product, partial [Symbiodinium natans]
MVASIFGHFYLASTCFIAGKSLTTLRRGALALPEARLVRWQGYPGRLLSGCQGSKKRTATPDLPITAWRCEIWTEGLFSLLFWALGWLEAEAATARQASELCIDWTDPRILLHGGSARYADNAWNHFFEQPTGEELSTDCLEGAASAGRLKIVVRFGPPWFTKFGEFRGADEGSGEFEGIRGGRLDDQTASAGREAIRRWIRVRPRIRQRVTEWCEGHAEALVGCLAVHIRRTDKLEQCRSNQWSEQQLAAQIYAFSAALGLHSVLLCSDDAALKLRLAKRLAD